MEEKIIILMREHEDELITTKEWNQFMRKFNLALETQDWDLFNKTQQELISY